MSPRPDGAAPQPYTEHNSPASTHTDRTVPRHNLTLNTTVQPARTQLLTREHKNEGHNRNVWANETCQDSITVRVSALTLFTAVRRTMRRFLSSVTNCLLPLTLINISTWNISWTALTQTRRRFISIQIVAFTRVLRVSACALPILSRVVFLSMA